MSVALLVCATLALNQPVPGFPFGPEWSLPSEPPTGRRTDGTGSGQREASGDPSSLTGAVPGGDEIKAPILTAPVVPELPAIEPARPVTPDRWFLMRELQGTSYGAILDDSRMSIYGWIDMTMTASTAKVQHQPVVWNDRANEYLLQQAWVRVGRSVVTSGTTEPTFGFQVDLLMGSDYRLTLPRGLLNSQLQNANGNQNLYGIDPIQHYVSAYVPTLFRGTEFRVGRVYTPWGVESVEAINTPMISRSYAFNWAPPFTHCGAGAYVTFSPVWSGVFLLANGNDVYFGDPAEEWRFVGGIKWTQPGGQNTVTVATTLGRGKFNAGDPFAATTLSLPNEPAGRNNLNAFDVVWTHLLNPRLSYNLETIFGYQTNVPGIFNANGGGTATWLAVAHYLFATVSPRVSTNVRLENFWDFQGQRTGFEGMYSSVTGLIQFKPRKDVILRAETRYDHNIESTPFEGKHGVFTAAAELILRW